MSRREAASGAPATGGRNGAPRAAPPGLDLIRGKPPSRDLPCGAAGRGAERPGVQGRRFAFVSTLDFILSRFRLELMERLVRDGADVFAVAPSGPGDIDWAAHGIRKLAYREERGSLRPLAAARVIRDLRDAIAEVDPDLVHTFTLSSNALGAAAARSIGKNRVVNTVTGLGSALMATRGTPSAKLRRQAVRLACRGGARLATEVVFENPDDRAYFVDRGWLPSGRGVVVPGAGVDVRHFRLERVPLERRAALRRRLGIAAGRPVVVMVARLLHDKGVVEFVEAARRLGPEAAEFLLVGGPDPGNPTSLTPRELASFRRSSPVRFAGWRTDIRECLAIGDVFVLPSYGEGLPRSTLEAMAMGLPVVTTVVPGCRETVRDGVNGYLVPPRDSAAVADRIGQLLDDPSLRSSMGGASRSRAAESFASDLVVERYLAVYRDIFSRPA